MDGASSDPARTRELVAAIDAGEAARVAALVARAPALVGGTVRWGAGGKNRCSPLHYAINAPFHGTCTGGRAVFVCRALLDAGADVESRASGLEPGETPLMTAASLNEVDVCALLLDRGADLEATGGVLMGGTALYLALGFGQVDAALLLARRGARAYDASMAAGLGELALLEHHLAAGPPTHRPLAPPAGGNAPPPDDDPLQRALSFALLHERLLAAELLLARGARVDAELDGATLLHWAAWSGLPRAAAFLLDRGADPTRRENVHGATPLEWADHARVARRRGDHGWNHPRADYDGVAAVLREAEQRRA